MRISEPTGRDLVPGFAAMITAAREMKGWSMAELAGQAELSVNTVSSIEREIRAPSLGVGGVAGDCSGVACVASRTGNPDRGPGSVPPPNEPARAGQRAAAKTGWGKAGGEK